jgi:hypothetical protein
MSLNVIQSIRMQKIMVTYSIDTPSAGMSVIFSFKLVLSAVQLVLNL